MYAVATESSLICEDKHKYFLPLKDDGVRALLDEVSEGVRPVALFSEVYGEGIGDFFYGMRGGKLGYRVFDLCVDGTYVDHGVLAELCGRHGVAMVPVLKEGPLDRSELRELVKGDTTPVCGCKHTRGDCDPAGQGAVWLE